MRSRCGVVSAKPALYDRLSGLDNLRYSAELYGLGRGAAIDARIAEAAARFGIDAALHDQVGGYSTGMKTRLALSRSVLHQPELLLYDEPTSGLDPESSHAVLELIREMTADGSTVVMCTHLLLEAEGLADQVVVLQDGTNLVEGSPDELTKRYWPDAMVRLGADDPAALDALAQPRRRRRLRARPTTPRCCGSTRPSGCPTSCSRSPPPAPGSPGSSPTSPPSRTSTSRCARRSGHTRLGTVDGSTV